MRINTMNGDVYIRARAVICALGWMVLTLPATAWADNGTWESKTDMPSPRWGAHASVVDGRIYVIGGLDTTPGSGPSGTVQVYDPTTDRWSMKADMPTARGFFDTAVVNGKIYAIGGSAIMNLHDEALAVVEEYDPGTDKWRRRADMQTGRADLTASVVNGKIDAIGGTRHVGVNSMATVEEYDPTSDTWTRKADMPTSRLHLTSGVIDDKIYVFGGSPEWAEPLAATEIYDPATDSWNRAPICRPSEREYGLLP